MRNVAKAGWGKSVISDECLGTGTMAVGSEDKGAGGFQFCALRFIFLSLCDLRWTWDRDMRGQDALPLVFGPCVSSLVFFFLIFLWFTASGGVLVHSTAKERKRIRD